MVLRLCRSSVRTRHGRSGPLPESGATVTGVRDRYHLANSRQKKKPKKKHAPSFKVVVRTPHRWSYCAQYSSLSKDIHAHCTILTSSKVTYSEIGIRAFSNTMKLFLEKKRVSLES